MTSRSVAGSDRLSVAARGRWRKRKLATASPGEPALTTGPADVREECRALAEDLVRGDPHASVHLARLIEKDHGGALRPYAEALAARLVDHLERWQELGAVDIHRALQDQLYPLFRLTADDWDGLPHEGRPGEEA